MAAAHFVEGQVHLFGVDAVLAQHAGYRALLLLRKRDEQVLGADVLVAETVGLGLGPGEGSLGPGSHEYLVGRVRRPGGLLQQAVEPRAHGVTRSAELGKEVGANTLVLLKQRHEDVLGVPLAVPVAADHLLGLPQDFLCLFGKTVGTQHHLPPSALRECIIADLTQVSYL